jgi:xanthine dehydrogenase accessory factor
VEGRVAGEELRFIRNKIYVEEIYIEGLAMQSLDLDVLEQATQWRRAGHEVNLITVVETFGSSPRPPGALLAVRDDAVVASSVSGGCVEDDLIYRVRHGERISKPQLITYGVTRDEAARFGLPCGGTLRLVQEPLTDYAWAETVIAETAEHRLVARTRSRDRAHLRRSRRAQRGGGFRWQDPRATLWATLATFVDRRGPGRNSSPRSRSRWATRC